MESSQNQPQSQEPKEFKLVHRNPKKTEEEKNQERRERVAATNRLMLETPIQELVDKGILALRLIPLVMNARAIYHGLNISALVNGKRKKTKILDLEAASDTEEHV